MSYGPLVTTRRSLLLLAASQLLLPRLAFAAAADGAPVTKTLVCVFLRGAVDGLSVVVPYTDPDYYAERKSIAIAPPGQAGGALPLDGRFGLHPRLPSLKAAYDAGELLPVHAVGSPNPTRSHFEAQDFMETATPGVRTRSGWLGRCLETGASPSTEQLRAVALSGRMPLSLRGAVSVISTPGLDRMDVKLPKHLRDAGLSALTKMYAGGDDHVTLAGRSALSVAERLRALGSSEYQPENGAEYAKPAREFRDLAALIKADVGLQVACIDVGGWDTHQGQGNAETGRLARALESLDGGLGALRRDLGHRFENVVILVMSEFGRTVRENGTGGTDHGHGTVMLLLGGAVHGGRVYGQFPGLSPEVRFEGRDLAVTTDFREVFGEVALKQLGVPHPESLFPGFSSQGRNSLGLLR